MDSEKSNLNIKKNAYLFIAFTSLVTARIMSHPSGTFEGCLKNSFRFKCELYYFFEDIFEGWKLFF